MQKNIGYLRPNPNENALIRLFCFHHAGGGASAYTGWHTSLPIDIDLVALQLPGRENRIGEQPFTDFDSLTDKLIEEIYPLLDRPFVFFGHSMGGLIAYETAKRLRKTKNIQPEHLFVSAITAPTGMGKTYFPSHLDGDELVRLLSTVNGTPKAVLQDKKLMNYILPTIRADYTLLNSYCYMDDEALSLPITAFGGQDDQNVKKENMVPWERQTTKKFKLLIIPGDHFFIIGSREIFMELFSKELRYVLKEITSRKEEQFLEDLHNTEKKNISSLISKSRLRGESLRKRLRT
jgi:Predicted thioesterase involved in non-ribosomal peptide biosynthesis